jgi:hypothetical protein
VTPGAVGVRGGFFEPAAEKKNANIFLRFNAPQKQ